MEARQFQTVEMTPDRVCAIVSPGHERNDTLTLFLILQRCRVPFYWLIWPEDRSLVAYRLNSEHYQVTATCFEPGRARIAPFDAIEIDLHCFQGD